MGVSAGGKGEGSEFEMAARGGEGPKRQFEEGARHECTSFRQLR